MSYDNTNSGALFKNEKRESDTHPHYKGSINIEGKEYWINSWVNTSKAGANYLSLKATPKDQQSTPAPKPAEPDFEDLDNDLPF